MWNQFCERPLTMNPRELNMNILNLQSSKKDRLKVISPFDISYPFILRFNLSIVCTKRKTFKDCVPSNSITGYSSSKMVEWGNGVWWRYDSTLFLQPHGVFKRKWKSNGCNDGFISRRWTCRNDAIVQLQLPSAVSVFLASIERNRGSFSTAT